MSLCRFIMVPANNPALINLHFGLTSCRLMLILSCFVIQILILNLCLTKPVNFANVDLCYFTAEWKQQ